MTFNTVQPETLEQCLAPVIALVEKTKPSPLDVEDAARRMHMQMNYTVGTQTVGVQEATNLLRNAGIIDFSTQIPYVCPETQQKRTRTGYCLPSQANEYARQHQK